MLVREATMDDEGVVTDIYVASRRAAWRGLLDEGYLDRLDVEEEGRHLWTSLAPQHAGWRILVCEEQGRVVGFVSVDPSGRSKVGHIGALFVAPDLFGSGVGTRLLEAAEDLLRDAGFTEAILWTLEEDHRLIRFYERRGWKLDGARQTIELDKPRTVLRCRKRLDT